MVAQIDKDLCFRTGRVVDLIKGVSLDFQIYLRNTAIGSAVRENIKGRHPSKTGLWSKGSVAQWMKTRLGWLGYRRLRFKSKHLYLNREHVTLHKTLHVSYSF